LKKLILAMAILVLTTGCKNTEIINKRKPTDYSIEKVSMSDKAHGLLDVYDPLEPFNKRVYYYNAIADKYVFNPVAKAYTRVVPEPARDSVNNFFDNIQAPVKFVNAILQGESEMAFEIAGSSLVNTTLGLGGLFNVAKKNKVPQHKRTFGETMAMYGVKRGPFLMIPFFGPTNFRDGTGKIMGFAVREPLSLYDVYSGNTLTDMGLNSIKYVDFRGRINFEYYGTDSPFEYEYARMLYDSYQDLIERRTKERLKRRKAGQKREYKPLVTEYPRL